MFASSVQAVCSSPDFSSYWVEYRDGVDPSHWRADRGGPMALDSAL